MFGGGGWLKSPYILIPRIFAESYLHTIHAYSNIAYIPVAYYNVILIALPLDCVISPCQADNISSHDVDMLMVTTIIQYNGSFGSHHFPSTEIKWLPHAMKFTGYYSSKENWHAVCHAEF